MFIKAVKKLADKYGMSDFKLEIKHDQPKPKKAPATRGKKAGKKKAATPKRKPASKKKR